TLKAKDELVPIYNNPDAASPVVAQLENGVLGTLKVCNGAWCRIAGNNFDGWIRQERLWGAYPNEKLD
ncbi:MAG: aspartyl-trna synthetase, partial [Pseudolabrys sp.]|nr:aspartyl-trna synthetase [Pseudolabrys sp.]